MRLREEGQVCFGEAFVVPAVEANLVEKIEDAARRAYDLHWRIQDLAIKPRSESCPDTTIAPLTTGNPAQDHPFGRYAWPLRRT